MKISRLYFAFLLLVGCTNTVPQVGELGRLRPGRDLPSDGIPSNPVIRADPALTSEFVQPGAGAGAGPEQTSTGGYKAKVVIHSGTQGSRQRSPSGYQLEIRSLSR